MKVVHLTTFHHGGAGNAAIQLHKALLESGVNSSMLFVQSLNGKTYLPNCDSLSRQSFLLRLKNKFRQFSRHNTLQSDLNAIKHLINAEGTTLPYAEYNVLDHPQVRNADILHLHWIAGMINYTEFFKKCNKKIVWTLHDMNPISGLFFYKEDEVRNSTIAEKLNIEVLNIKRKAFNTMHASMYITAPSKWLSAQATESILLRKFKCSTIPYIADMDSFYPRSKQYCRKELNISESATIFLFAAMSVNNRRKGFDLLIDALSEISNERNSVEIIAIGNINNSLPDNLRIKFTGEISDKTLLTKYYSAADAFILPSREDNLPNTMLESFACGLPVIGFPIGGVKEYVINKKTGYLAEEVNSISLAKAIKQFMDDPTVFSSEEIRRFAEESFSKEKVVFQFKKLYNQLISEN